MTTGTASCWGCRAPWSSAWRHGAPADTPAHRDPAQVCSWILLGRVYWGWRCPRVNPSCPRIQSLHFGMAPRALWKATVLTWACPPGWDLDLSSARTAADTLALLLRPMAWSPAPRVSLYTRPAQASGKTQTTAFWTIPPVALSPRFLPGILTAHASAGLHLYPELQLSFPWAGRQAFWPRAL